MDGVCPIDKNQEISSTDQSSRNSKIENKTILIIGGTGSLGNKLTTHLGKNKLNKIVVFSRDENKQWSMKKKYQNKNEEYDISFMIGDARNEKSILRVMQTYHPDYVIFAAALKHIDICENNIDECVKTNTLGISNVINVINMMDRKPESVLYISTDKACNPITSYGCSKSLGERLVRNESKRNTSVNFVICRYGNICASRGSLLEVYRNIANDPNQKNFLVTDENMTRFFMTLLDAIELIQAALLYGNSGEIWIKVAPSLKIMDVAKYYATKYQKGIKMVGLRCEEKMNEDLYSDYEAPYIFNRSCNGSLFHVIGRKVLPADQISYTKGYDSSHYLTGDEAKVLIEYFENL